MESGHVEMVARTDAMLLRGAKSSENRRGEDRPLLQALEKARPANCGFRFLASRTMREEMCFGCQCSAALAWGSVGEEAELCGPGLALPVEFTQPSQECTRRRGEW